MGSRRPLCNKFEFITTKKKLKYIYISPQIKNETKFKRRRTRSHLLAAQLIQTNLSYEKNL